MTQKGICTGGGFYENVGCKPYPIEPCGTHTVDGTTHYHNCTGIPDPDTPTCTAECTNKDYTTKYADDKYYGKCGIRRTSTRLFKLRNVALSTPLAGKSAYAVKRSVDAIKQEIFDNGPVEVAFTVYEDFDQYTGGIYKVLVVYRRRRLLNVALWCAQSKVVIAARGRSSARRSRSQNDRMGS